MNEQERDDKMKLIEQTCSRLQEHFDSVQIFATKHDPTMSEGTINWHYGSGNWFTRWGQIKDWISRKESEMYSND